KISKKFYQGSSLGPKTSTLSLQASVENLASKFLLDFFFATTNFNASISTTNNLITNTLQQNGNKTKEKMDDILDTPNDEKKMGKSDNNWEGNMNELAQQIQEMKIGYNKLAAQLTTQAEANNPRTRPPARVTTMVTCYKYSKKGYYARECLTEREAPVPSERRPAQPSHTLRHEVEANYGNINADYDLEREVFARERYQPYQRQNNNRPPNSESQWEDRLRNRNNVNIQPRKTRETYPIINDDDLMQYLEEKISKMNVSKELNDEQQKEAKEMLKKEKEVFA
ncbi:2543_t:CDS:2, partial [Racocetra fulgida]